MENKTRYKRYQRQILLKGFGISAQEKLLKARVLVIGAGGLGCPALQYLAAAGMGCIGIVDYDEVDISNLHRQVLYSADDVGKPKARVAAEKLKAFNPEILIQTFNTKLTNENALKIISGFDVVIDGSDNFPTRYLVNDACVLLNKPLIYGSVFRFEGQVAVFNCGEENARTNYRDLFPEPPSPDEVPDCNEAGVIGTLPGVIGTMQANEAIKIITGIGDVLANKLLTCNALDTSFFEVQLFQDTDAQHLLPESGEQFLKMNYELFCNSESGEVHEIAPEKFEKMLEGDNILVVDVRKAGELPQADDFAHIRIPLDAIEKNISMIDVHKKIIVFCRSGTRSAIAAKKISELTHSKSVYNLNGGIIAWEKYQGKQVMA